MPIPFQVSKNRCHHIKSDLKVAFRCTKDLFLPHPFKSSKILLKNVLPGQTTLHVCCSLPAKDCKSLTVQYFLISHSPIISFKVLNLFSGRRRIKFSVFLSMPRKVSCVVHRTLNLLWHHWYMEPIK